MTVDLHALAQNPDLHPFAQAVADILQPVPVPPPTGTVLWERTYTGAEAVTPFGWTWGVQLLGSPTPTWIPTNGVMSMTLPASAESLHAEGLQKYIVKVGDVSYHFGRWHVPVNWQEPSPAGWGCALTQTNYQAFVNSTLGIFLHAKRAQISVLSGKQSWPDPSKPGIGVPIREYDNTNEANTLAKWWLIDGIQGGAIYAWVFGVRSAYDGTGWVEGHVYGGQYTTWMNTVKRTMCPTLQWGRGYNFGQGSSSINLGAEGYNACHKHGMYAGPANFARQYKHSKVGQATSLEAAKAAVS